MSSTIRATRSTPGQRGRLAVITAAGGMLFTLASCSSSDTPESATSGNESTPVGSSPASASTPTGWTFTDDRGVTVTLDETPDSIVAYQAPAAALWHFGVTPVGIFGTGPMQDAVQLDGVDLTGIESVGEVYDEIELEKVAALDPDIIVTAYNPTSPDLPWGLGPVAAQKKLEAIAPVVVINGVKDPTDVIDRFGELAESLGADPGTPSVVAAKEAFEATVADFKAATAAHSDVDVLAIGAYDQFYLARPALFPQLRQMQQWGLNLVEPTGGAEGDFYELASFEEAAQYPADMLMYDTNPGALDLEALAEIPTWANLPAVKAGALVPYSAVEDWSWAQYTLDLRAVIDGLESADPGLAP